MGAVRIDTPNLTVPTVVRHADNGHPGLAFKTDDAGRARIRTLLVQPVKAA